MLTKSQLRKRLEFIGAVLSVSALVGISVAYSVTSEAFDPATLMVGAVQGMVIGLGCSASEVLVLSNPTLRLSRHLPPLALLLLRAIAYGVSILLGLSLQTLLIGEPPPWRDPDFLAIFAVSFGVAGGMALLTETIRLLGTEAAQSLVSGRYHRPRLEDRVILIADVVGSTAMGEALGELRFHTFLGDVALDLSAPIERADGAVHRYVGDSVIVTWPQKRGSNSAPALNCARWMHDILQTRAPRYHATYGQAPQLRIAIHRGRMAAGVIGNWKREIALLGDVMNTAARIETAAGQHGEAIVLSDAAAQALPAEMRRGLRPLPPFAAAGKREPLTLWAADAQ